MTTLDAQTSSSLVIQSSGVVSELAAAASPDATLNNKPIQGSTILPTSVKTVGQVNEVKQSRQRKAVTCCACACVEQNARRVGVLRPYPWPPSEDFLHWETVPQLSRVRHCPEEYSAYLPFVEKVSICGMRHCGFIRGSECRDCERVRSHYRGSRVCWQCGQSVPLLSDPCPQCHYRPLTVDERGEIAEAPLSKGQRQRRNRQRRAARLGGQESVPPLEEVPQSGAHGKARAGVDLVGVESNPGPRRTKVKNPGRTTLSRPTPKQPVQRDALDVMREWGLWHPRGVPRPPLTRRPTMVIMPRANPRPQRRSKFRAAAATVWSGVKKAASFVLPIVGRALLSFLGVAAGVTVHYDHLGRRHLTHAMGVAVGSAVVPGQVLMKYRMSVGPAGSRSRQMAELYEKYQVHGLRLVITPSAALTNTGVLGYVFVPDSESTELENMTAPELLATITTRPGYRQVNVRDRATVSFQLPQSVFYIRSLDTAERMTSPGSVYVVSITSVESTVLPVVEVVTQYSFSGTSSAPQRETHKGFQFSATMNTSLTMSKYLYYDVQNFAGFSMDVQSLAEVQCEAFGDYSFLWGLPALRLRAGESISVSTEMLRDTLSEHILNVPHVYSGHGDSFDIASVKMLDYQPGSSDATMGPRQFYASVDVDSTLVFLPGTVAEDSPYEYNYPTSTHSSPTSWCVFVASGDRVPDSVALSLPERCLPHGRGTREIPKAEGKSEALSPTAESPVLVPASVLAPTSSLSAAACVPAKLRVCATALPRKKLAGSDLVGVETNPGPGGRTGRSRKARREKKHAAASMEKPGAVRVQQVSALTGRLEWTLKKKRPAGGQLRCRRDADEWSEASGVEESSNSSSMPEKYGMAGSLSQQLRRQVGMVLPMSKTPVVVQAPPKVLFRKAYKPGTHAASTAAPVEEPFPCLTATQKLLRDLPPVLGHARNRPLPMPQQRPTPKVWPAPLPSSLYRAGVRAKSAPEVPSRKGVLNTFVRNGECVFPPPRRTESHDPHQQSDVYSIILRAVAHKPDVPRSDAWGVVTECVLSYLGDDVPPPLPLSLSPAQASSLKKCGQRFGPRTVKQELFDGLTNLAVRKLSPKEDLFDGRLGVKTPAGKSAWLVPMNTAPAKKPADVVTRPAGKVEMINAAGKATLDRIEQVVGVMAQQLKVDCGSNYPLKTSVKLVMPEFARVVRNSKDQVVGALVHRGFVNQDPKRGLVPWLKSTVSSLKRGISRWWHDSPYVEPAPVHEWVLCNQEAAESIFDPHDSEQVAGVLDLRQTSSLACKLRRPLEDDFYEFLVHTSYDAYSQCSTTRIQLHRMLCADLVARFGLRSFTRLEFDAAFDVAVKPLNVNSYLHPELREATFLFVRDYAASVRNRHLKAGLDFQL